MAGQNSIATLVARLTADSTGFTAGLAQAQASLSTFEGRVRSSATVAQRGFSQLQSSVSGVTGAFAAATRWIVPLGVSLSILSAVENARQFEQQLNTIAAISRGSAGDMARLEAAIRRVGLATGAGAVETAHAADELIRVTGNFDQTIGALQSVVTLARATGESVENAAAVALHAMRDFGLGAEDMQHVVNGAAGVIKHSMITTLEDYANALGAGGGALHTLGVEMDDFNAVVGLTSSGFSSGQATATAFKTALIRLIAPSQAARRVMDEIGLSVFDAEGNFVGMQEVVRRLQTSLHGLTQEQRDHVLAVIAGTRGISTLSLLYADGADALAHYRDVTLADSDVNQIAARRWQGVNGAVANLNAQWQDLSVTLGESGVDTFLANTINLVASLVGGLRQAGDLLAGLPGAADTHGSAAALTSRLADEQRRLSDAREVMRQLANANNSGPRGPYLMMERHRAEAAIPRLEANVAALQSALNTARRASLPEVNVGVDVFTPRDRQAYNRRLAEALRTAGDGGALDAEGLRQALAGHQGLTAAQREGNTAQREFNEALTGVETPMERYVDELKNLLGLQQRFPQLSNPIESVLGRTTKNFIESTAQARGLSDELRAWEEFDPQQFRQVSDALAYDIQMIGEGGDRASLGVQSLTGTINTLMTALDNMHRRSEAYSLFDQLQNELTTPAERIGNQLAERLQHLARFDEIGIMAPGQSQQMRERIERDFFDQMAGANGSYGAAIRFTRDLQGDLRDAWINGDWSNIGQSIQHAWRAFLWDALIGDDLTNWMNGLARQLHNMLGNVLQQALQGVGGGVGGGGNIFSDMLSSIFGNSHIGWNSAPGGGDLFYAGGFARGGFIPPGGWGITGEDGPEPIFGGRTGVSVIPNGASRDSGPTYNIAIDARGADAGVEQRIRIAVKEATAQGAQAGAALVYKRLRAGSTL